MKKTLFLGATLLFVLTAQTGVTSSVITVTGTGTGQSITGTFTLTLAPSALTATCSPSVIQKGGSAACIVALDQTVQAGATFTGTPTLPTGSGLTIAPTTFTIPTGSSTCGTAITACFTVSRP